MRSVTCLILPRSRHSIMSMARGRNSRFIIAVSMDKLFANCETILDSLYMSILLDPSLFVFQNFSFIIFLTLLDVIGLVWFCFFLIMTVRLRHQWKKTHRYLPPISSPFLIQFLKGMTILYTRAYFNSVPEDMQCFEFYVYILLGIKQNFWEPVPTESISTP